MCNMVKFCCEKSKSAVDNAVFVTYLHTDTKLRMLVTVRERKFLGLATVPKAVIK